MAEASSPREAKVIQGILLLATISPQVGPLFSIGEILINMENRVFAKRESTEREMVAGGDPSRASGKLAGE